MMPIKPGANSAPAENRGQQPKPGSLDTFQFLQPISSWNPLAFISRLTSTKRKRSPDTDAEAEIYEPEGLRPLEPPQGLSEEDLRSLYEEVMNSSFNKARFQSLKRSTSPSRTQGTTQTKSTSKTNAFYRFKTLDPYQIKFNCTSPPEGIQDAIDAIVYVRLPEGRYEELVVIAQRFQARCIKLASAGATEADCVAILRDALLAMDFDFLCLGEKLDWKAQLMPKFQPLPFNRGFKGNHPIFSPYIPKTPRPDITIGLQLGALASPLSSEAFTEEDAILFITYLEEQMESRGPDSLEEPMLISRPAPCAADLVFPFAVDEGKAYLTGRQIAEAENQAAGAGACALRMQLRLDELVKRIPTEPLDDLPVPSENQILNLPSPSEDQIPLCFSICTEGPVHLLYVHWTEVKGGRRQYNMMPLKCVHGMLWEGLVDFFVVMDNVLRWGTGHFLESLVTRLRKLVEHFVTE
jgi:hypothetical protein